MAAPPIFDACALFGPWPRHDELELPDLLGAMKSSNIARSLALSTTGMFYDFRAGNAATLEAARANPGELLPTATLDPRAYPACLAEIESIARAGLRLVRFFPSQQGWPIRFAPFQELLSKCDQLGVRVAVDIHNAGDITELADSVAFTTAPILLAGVESQHLGEAMCVMRSAPKFHIETTHLNAPGALEAIVQNVPDGAQKLVFASYSPLRYGSSALGTVLASALTGDQKALALAGNLTRLLSK